ncbi:MAG: Nif3-like dinuclear metal center hexameric protein [Spiroplasma sp.]|nr:Nif3-like dinuclear metal center hexameric protein [Spiroplasma sp.]
MMKLFDLIKKIEVTFMLKDSCDWDFVGWQVLATKKDFPIKSVLITLDVTNSVIEAAIKDDIKLIICHHPFIFAKNINDATINQTKKILYQKLLKHQINVYVLHTNFDTNLQGMNWLIAKDLKLNDLKFFDRDKLAVIGSYSNLTLSEVINNLKNYFAFEIIKVITNNLQTKINYVVLSSGAGGSIIETISNNDDISLLITGEMKWHQELEARDKNISVIVLGHNMEEKFVNFITNFLLSDPIIKKNIVIKQHFFPKAIFI